MCHHWDPGLRRPFGDFQSPRSFVFQVCIKAESWYTLVLQGISWSDKLGNKVNGWAERYVSVTAITPNYAL